MLLHIEDVTLPVWVDMMCMEEYIPNLEENLRAQVSKTITPVNARRLFIKALVPHFGNPLGTETIFCTRVSILIASEEPLISGFIKS